MKLKTFMSIICLMILTASAIAQDDQQKLIITSNSLLFNPTPLRNLSPPPPPPPNDAESGTSPSPIPPPGQLPPPPTSENKQPVPSPTPIPTTQATSEDGENPDLPSPPVDGNGLASPSPTPIPGTEAETQEGTNTEQLPPPPPPDLTNLTAEELQALTAEQGAAITPEQGGAITVQQIRHIPPGAIAGFGTDTLLAMPPDTIRSLSQEQVRNINPEDFKSALAEELGEFLISLDPDSILINDAKQLLPSSWEINAQNGELKPPPKTKLSLPKLPAGATPGYFPPDNVPDLSKSFSLGGENGSSFLESANQSLSKAGMQQFQFSQDENSGKINFNHPDIAATYSLAPDAEGIYQVDSGEGIGFQLNQYGFYVLTTESQQQLTLRPTPLDPASIGSMLNSDVFLGERGDVLVHGENTLIAAIFGSEIQSAPDGAAVGPLLRDNGEFLYVFESGQAQRVFASPNDPDLLINLLYQHMPDVSDLYYQSDGTLTGWYKGNAVIIQTEFSAQLQVVPDNSDNQSGSLSFAELADDGSLVLFYRSPLPSSDSNARARVSDSDVEQRVVIKYTDSETQSITSECLDSAQKPSHFIQFIEQMTRCKFIFY